MVRSELPGNTRLRTCRNFMDGEVGTGLLFYLTHANAHKGFQAAIDDKPADERKTATGQRADQLGSKTYPAKATKGLRTENTGSQTAPCAGQSV